MVEHMTGTPLTQVRLPGAARDCSPRVNSQCRLSYGVRTPPCAIASIYICAHVKDPVVHVRIRWMMEILKHPAYTVGLTARLCRSWHFFGESNSNFPWEKSQWDNTVVKKIWMFLISRCYTLSLIHHNAVKCFERELFKNVR